MSQEQNSPSPTNRTIEEAAKEYSENKYPYVWPLNKDGEKVTLLVGQKNPPGSRKAKDKQEAHAKSFIAGANHVLSSSAGVWVKAIDRLPQKDYNYFVRASKTNQGYCHNDTAWFKEGKFLFIENDGRYVVEWLDERTNQ